MAASVWPERDEQARVFGAGLFFVVCGDREQHTCRLKFKSDGWSPETEVQSQPRFLRLKKDPPEVAAGGDVSEEAFWCMSAACEYGTASPQVLSPVMPSSVPVTNACEAIPPCPPPKESDFRVVWTSSPKSSQRL
ncbi:hypothetical protein PRBEI_2001517200 [Prionailurus iriomotensis]